MAQFYRCFIKKIYLYHGTNHKVDEENRTLYLDHKVSKNLGSDQIKIHGSTNSNTCKLGIRVSCAHECIIICNKCNVGTKPNW
jgi:hypothetical protein